MLEEFLGELKSPIRALWILSRIYNSYLNGNIDLFFNESEKEFRENQYSMIYAIQLISEDIMSLRKEYYEKISEKYAES